MRVLVQDKYKIEYNRLFLMSVSRPNAPKSAKCTLLWITLAQSAVEGHPLYYDDYTAQGNTSIRFESEAAK